MMTTDKESINHLVEICRKEGIQNVIFSPGSRNAPLVIAFHAAEVFNIITIPDERVAAFVAVGQGIATGQATVICCTSGSAALNYAPAIVEAYYQRVPLLVITADRPSQWIDQGIGQSMRQSQVYANYIKASYDWLEEAQSTEDLAHNDQLAYSAIAATRTAPYGPVHINIPFEEPLYNQISYTIPKLSEQVLQPGGVAIQALEDEDLNLWLKSKRKMIICGLLHPSNKLYELLANLSEREDIVLLTETTSNVFARNSVHCLDRVLHRLEIDSSTECDLLISVGGPIISKKIKKYFQSNKPINHWYVNEGACQNTYDSDPKHFCTEPKSLLEILVNNKSKNDLIFQKSWIELQLETSSLHDKFLDTAPYSDLIVFQAIYSRIPDSSTVHLANSTPVRYMQLFDQRPDLRFYSNRGVSGIDGSTSTAIGIASLEKEMNILITGDMSFFYDSNAFWQRSLPNNLLIILVNNGGGGIFRFIPGPESTDHLERVFEASHDMNAEQICIMYKLDYLKATGIRDLNNAMDHFYRTSKGCQLIEVFTPKEINAEVLKAYFNAMKTS